MIDPNNPGALTADKDLHLRYLEHESQRLSHMVDFLCYNIESLSDWCCGDADEVRKKAANAAAEQMEAV